MAVAELRRWALASNWGVARLTRLERYLQRFHIVLVDVPLCQRWAEVMEAADRAGMPTGVARPEAVTANGLGGAVAVRHRQAKRPPTGCW